MLLNIRIFLDHFGLAPEKSTLLKLLCTLRGENLSWILLDFVAAKWYFARQSTAKGTEIFLRKACVFDSLTANQIGQDEHTKIVCPGVAITVVGTLFALSFCLCND